MFKKLFFFFIFIVPFEIVLSKETASKLCYKRGVEIILPYEFGISNIKRNFSYSNKLKQELRNYKIMFEKTFYGLDLYESSGCSKARLSEYLECLVETDGKDCKIYYSQMRLVD